MEAMTMNVVLRTVIVEIADRHKHRHLHLRDN